jgi:hypothetical protein
MNPYRSSRGWRSLPELWHGKPRASSLLHVVWGDAVPELSFLRYREPGRREVLHRVRDGAWGRRIGRGGAPTGDDAAAPLPSRGSGPGAPCGSARRTVRRPAPGRRRARVGLAGGRRPAGGTPQGNGAVRRPARLHGDRRAHGPRGREVDRRPGPAAARRGSRSLRRHRGQVHRRQRDGGLRCPRVPRGRPGARRAGGAGHAGGDGRDQPRYRGRVRGQLLAEGRDQLRRGAGWSGRGRVYGHGRRRERRRQAPGGGETGERDRRRDHPAPDPRRDRVLRAGAAGPEGQVRAGACMGGRPPPDPRAGHPGRSQRRAPDRP